jgi:hypothetical protein
MTVADFLAKVAGIPADLLIAVLDSIINSGSEFSEKAREIKEKFVAPLSITNLVAVAALIPKEALDILAGKIDPRDHPSDAA